MAALEARPGRCRRAGPSGDGAVARRAPTATATVDATGRGASSVAAGEALDEVVLRSYAVGAVHQALGWVRSEGVAVDEDGTVLDLTIRSFGIITGAGHARASRWWWRTIVGHRVPAGDTVFAAVAAAAWLAAGLPSVVARGPEEVAR